jgi:hypothetical protein
VRELKNIPFGFDIIHTEDFIQLLNLVKDLSEKDLSNEIVMGMMDFYSRVMKDSEISSPVKFFDICSYLLEDLLTKTFDDLTSEFCATRLFLQIGSHLNENLNRWSLYKK